MQTIGTCSICGGAVMVYEHWGRSTPASVRCSQCGAIPKEPFGKTIPMKGDEDIRIKKFRKWVK